MVQTHFLGTGHYLPDKIVHNDDFQAMGIDTSDAWIMQRTGIRTRHYVDFNKQPMGSSDLATLAATEALLDAGVDKEAIDLIIYATLSPDKVFPGDGVLVQAKLDIPSGVPALDIRNQCSGFLYGLAVADAFIKQQVYQKILLIGAEVHSSGLDFSTKGRDVTVLFGDGAAAVVLGGEVAKDATNRGILSVHLHADGRFADDLHCSYPSSAHPQRVSADMLATGAQYPHMHGKNVFKQAISRMPEVIIEALAAHDMTPDDIDLLISHQANLRIIEMVQKSLGLSDDRVFTNIQTVGNTTACSVPLALHQAKQQSRIKPGDVVVLVTYGAGATWAAAVIRWQ